MAHDDIRARLAAARTVIEVNRAFYVAPEDIYGDYVDDVDALLRANEAQAKALRDRHAPTCQSNLLDCDCGLGRRQRAALAAQPPAPGITDGDLLDEIMQAAEEFIDAAHYGPSTRAFDKARDRLRAALAAAETGAEK